MSTMPAPDFPLEVLRGTIAQRYGLTVNEPQNLPGEYDRNLRFVDDQGRIWVAKISALQAVKAVGWQALLLDHLENATLDCDVPRILPALDGARHVAVSYDGKRGLLRVQSWVEGVPMRHAPVPGEQLLRSIGRVSAMLTSALADVEANSTPPRHHWLVEDSLNSFDTVVPELESEALAERLEPVRAAFAAIMPIIPTLPRSVVHQDLHDENLLVDPIAEEVVGVIDFNDSFNTVRVADLAVAGAYAMLRQDDPVAALAQVVTGYLQRRSLTADELAALLPMSAMRLAINAATWAVRSAESGEPYAEDRSKFTRPTLERLLDEGLDSASERLATLIKAAIDPAAVSLEGRRFVAAENSATGQVGDGTVFHYHEADNMVWADYAGGAIRRGRLIGTRNGAELDFRYVHLDNAGVTSTGHCTSTLEVDVRIRLHETWTWESKEGQGTSLLIELVD
ncbi:hypothetical protein EG850_04850 [Gulosibacter macacae]|uniref:Hydroxylysine kinase n=1 Tax=Gulosibacter macacae TaxID=2488791 RepID=A0A3P3VWI3_9MICO|nr:phosphotransferase [Gulosibacter macacae]RRJ87155.1 hypothetical protein EG850_04850 [Gulosibacter macacae]